MRNEVQNDAVAAYREVAGTAAPVTPSPQQTSGQPEQPNRYAVTPEKEQYIRKVMQIAADEKANNVPDVDERMMRLRERISLEEKDALDSRKEASQARSPSRRAEEIMNHWTRTELSDWYDKKKEVIGEQHARLLHEIGTGRYPSISFEEKRAALEQAFAEAGVSGNPPRRSAEESRARWQHALQIAHAELSGQQ